MVTILIVDDDAALRDGISETVGDFGHGSRLAGSGREALRIIAAEEIDGVLLDLRMPGDMDGIEVLRRVRESENPPPVAVLTAFASAENTIQAMRLGAFDHLTKPVGRQELAALLSRMLARHRAPVTTHPGEADAGGLIGASAAMRSVHKAIGLAADTDATVLILGETGTGKEVVARALHEYGERKTEPFVAVNCAAIPAELLESELFGHVKGAFTGASADRAGAFRAAGRGSLFLDEIGDMPSAMQAKILRALQEKIVMPVGGKATGVHARVIAATHRDLPALVAAGRFREDLYYRLNVVPIALPPLRERREDILLLAEHFLRRASRNGTPKQLTAAAARRLTESSWPGNVRELKNAIERVNVLVRGEVIDATDLDILDRVIPSLTQSDPLDDDLPTAVAKLEKAMIESALEACRGNRAEAARRLNIHRQLLYAKMRRYGLTDESASETQTSGVRKADK
jgi:two-component system NtrC family response regulator